MIKKNLISIISNQCGIFLKKSIFYYEITTKWYYWYRDICKCSIFHNSVNIKYQVLKMCANCSPPLKILYNKFSESPNFQSQKICLNFWWKKNYAPRNCDISGTNTNGEKIRQVDVRSILYFQIWCSCIWTVSSVV